LIKFLQYWLWSFLSQQIHLDDVWVVDDLKWMIDKIFKRLLLMYMGDESFAINLFWMGFCMFQRKFHIQHVGYIFHVHCSNHIFQHLFGNSGSKSRTYHRGCNFHNYNGNDVEDDMILVFMQKSCLYLWIYANHKKILNNTLENIHDKLNKKINIWKGQMLLWVVIWKYYWC
jgi:hypothetical protein